MSNKELKNKTYNALMWSSIDRFSEQIIRFVFSIILARLLLPTDFGLIGMVYIIVEVARVFMQGGLGSALINKKNVEEVDICSVFYTNIAVAICIYCIIFFCAPLIGGFYRNDLLVPIIRVLSIDIIINSIGTIQTALMTKNVDFKKQTLVSIPTVVLSGGIGITLACFKWGVWALVAQSLFRTFFYTTLMWLIHKWRPKLLFSLKAVWELFKYGSGLLVNNSLFIIFNNIFTIIIGKLYGFEKLGYFTRAQQTLNLPVNSIWAIIGRVSFPVLSSIKDDQAKFKLVVKKAINEVASLYFPMITFALMLAPDIFNVLFGKKWDASIKIFQLLCFSSLTYPLEQIYNSSINAKGESKITMVLKFIKYTSVILSVIFTYKHGMEYMLILYSAVIYLNFVISAIIVQKYIKYRVVEQLADVAPVFACSILSCIPLYYLNLYINSKLIGILVIKAIVGFLVYMLLSSLFHIEPVVKKINFVIAKSGLKKVLK